MLRNLISKVMCTVLLLGLTQYLYAQKKALPSQKKDLPAKISTIEAAHKASIGYAVLDLQSGKWYEHNGTKQFPMMSVYKFHLALAVLAQVDQGLLNLDQNIAIDKGDLDKDTWSPLRDKYPDGGVEIPLSELLSYTVAQSDNNGCDILFKLVGGASKVHDYIAKLGIKEVNIAATEREMKMYDKAKYTNMSTAHAACELLALFNKNTILSPQSHDFLWKVMSGDATGAAKIKGQLPKGTPVAHKTGYSGVNSAGVTEATNDIGIVTLPNGKRFAIAVFVTMSSEPESINESIIAATAKAAYDFLKP